MNEIDITMEQARLLAEEIGPMYGRKETADDFAKITFPSHDRARSI